MLYIIKLFFLRILLTGKIVNSHIRFLEEKRIITPACIFLSSRHRVQSLTLNNNQNAATSCSVIQIFSVCSTGCEYSTCCQHVTQLMITHYSVRWAYRDVRPVFRDDRLRHVSSGFMTTVINFVPLHNKKSN